MDTAEISYQIGLPERFRASAAALYDEAFGKKLAVAVRSGKSRQILLRNGLILDYAIVALSENRLIGIAGFHTPDGSFTGGINYSGLLSLLGFIKGNWAALIFDLYRRKPVPGELLIEGITVHGDARGKGVGGRLLKEIADYARTQGFSRISLDVVDTNPKAQKLYQRKGFKAVKTQRFPYLRWLFKFGASTTMALPVDAKT